jgi:hypothetical protein
MEKTFREPGENNESTRVLLGEAGVNKSLDLRVDGRATRKVGCNGVDCAQVSRMK